MAVFEVKFYDYRPSGQFRSSVGKTTIYNGPSSPVGTAIITDTETGIEEFTLDDDDRGRETATAEVTLGGITTTGNSVDGERGWSLRDTVTGEVFEMVEFEVEGGPNAGLYTLSERPLVPGRAYETVSYDSNPNVLVGDPVFDFNDYTDGLTTTDQVVSGTAGDDTVDTGYEGDPDGDQVDDGDANDQVEAGAGNDLIDASIGNDSVEAGAGNDTIIAGAGHDTLEGGDDQDRFVLTGSFGEDEITGGEGGTDGDTIDASALSAGVSVDITGNEKGELTDGTSEASFSEIEEFVLTDQDDTLHGISSIAAIGVEAGHGDDAITTGTGDDTIDFGTGQDTIISDSGDDIITDGGAVLSGASYDNYIDAGEGDDTVTGGRGDDTIYSGTGDDSISGGTGEDSLTAGAGNDLIEAGQGADTIRGGTGNDDIHAGRDADHIILQDAFGEDTIVGGEGGLDQDVIDASALTVAADVVLSDDEEGIITDGESTAEFSQVEQFILSNQDDSFDGSASATGSEVRGGSGNDTMIGGTGADTLKGGHDADRFDLEDGFGADSISGGESGTDSDTLNASAVTSALSVTMTSDEGGQITDGASTATFEQIEGFVLSDLSDLFNGATANAPFVVEAGGGDDTLIGGRGADTLTGGAGNDHITTGHGDQVTGGDGDDRFVINAQAGTGAISILGGEGGETLGDTLDFNGQLQTGSINYTNNNDAAGGFSGTATLLDGTIVNFANIETIICFAAGTLIATAAGERPVETLHPDDLVQTKDHGLQPLRWTGQRTVLATGNLAPIVITKGTLGNARDLIVSPQHRMLISGPKAELYFGEQEVLVAAKHLCNWDGIYQKDGGEITYHHLLFDTHEIVYAEGAASESFHPGEVGMSSLSQKSRDEIYRLFPELRGNPRAFGPAARACVKADEARLLKA